MNPKCHYGLSWILNTVFNWDAEPARVVMTLAAAFENLQVSKSPFRTNLVAFKPTKWVKTQV